MNKRIEKEQALTLIENSKGKIISVEFNAKKGLRKLNGQYLSSNKLGLVKMKEFKGEKGIRNFYIKDLVGFKANKVSYVVNK